MAHSLRLSLIAGCLFALSLSSLQSVAADTPLNGTGTIQAVTPSGWRVEVNGAPWIMNFAQNHKIAVVGAASLEMLQPGMLVRFNGTLDQHGKMEGEVSDIEFFTMQYEIKGEAKNRTVTPVTPPGNFTVTGKVKSFKNNKLDVITTIGQEVHAQVADGTILKVYAEVPQFIAPGDPFKVKGTYNIQGYLTASEVTVTLTKPIEPKKKKVLHAKPEKGDKADKPEKTENGLPPPPDLKPNEKPADKPAENKAAG